MLLFNEDPRTNHSSTQAVNHPWPSPTCRLIVRHAAPVASSCPWPLISLLSLLSFPVRQSVFPLCRYPTLSTPLVPLHPPPLNLIEVLVVTQKCGSGIVASHLLHVISTITPRPSPSFVLTHDKNRSWNNLQLPSCNSISLYCQSSSLHSLDTLCFLLTISAEHDRVSNTAVGISKAPADWQGLQTRLLSKRWAFVQGTNLGRGRRPCPPSR